jgi:hypothetical protein
MIVNKLIKILFMFLMLQITSISTANDIKFYTGAGLDYSKYGICKNNLAATYNLHRQGTGILMPLFGMKFHDHIGLESAYSFNRKITLNHANESEESYKVRNFYIDTVFFIPIIEQFDITIGGGLGRLILQKGQGVDDADIKNKFNWRVKLGVKHDVSENFSVYTAVNYQKAKNNLNNIQFVKNIKSIWLVVAKNF